MCIVIATVDHNYSRENKVLVEKASKMVIIDDAPDSPECDAYAMGEDVQSGDKNIELNDRRTHGIPRMTQATPQEVMETMRSFNQMFSKAQEEHHQINVSIL